MRVFVSEYRCGRIIASPSGEFEHFNPVRDDNIAGTTRQMSISSIYINLCLKYQI